MNSRHLRILAASGLAASTIAAGITARGFASGPSPALSSVTTRTLLADNVTLSPPLGDPTVSRTAAATVATAAFPGAAVREEVLARVRNTHLSPPLDDSCWVVSIMPAGGIWSPSAGGPGGKRMRGTYFLVFVDASTGRFIYATSGGEVR